MRAIKIQQILVGGDSTTNGDFSVTIAGRKVLDVRVECKADSGYNAIVGWNENANKDVLVPGQSKTYGIPTNGYIMSDLNVNFASGGSGQPKALVELFMEGEEIC